MWPKNEELLEIIGPIEYNDELIKTQTQENLKDLDDIYNILQMKAHIGNYHVGKKKSISPDFNSLTEYNNWNKIVMEIQNERSGTFNLSLILGLGKWKY